MAQYGPTSGWLMGPLLHADNLAIFPEIQIENGRPVAILMHGLNLESKEIVWTSKNFSSFPWLENGVLYHGGMDGTLHGTDLKTGVEVWQLGQPLLSDK